jgi:hypothetical protein
MSFPKGVTLSSRKVTLRLQGGRLGLPRPYIKPSSAKVPCQVSSIKPSLEQSPSSPNRPRVTSRARQVTSRPPKANVRVANGGSSSSSHAKVPPKATLSILKVQHPSSHMPQMWGLTSINGIQSPHGGPNEVISLRIPVHWARSCEHKQMCPPRVHKSQESCQVSHI